MKHKPGLLYGESMRRNAHWDLFLIDLEGFDIPVGFSETFG
jgi:hypothetical protein